MWFNDCVVGKSGQSANPIIAMVVPYNNNSIIIYAHVYVYESINWKNSQTLGLI